MNGLPQAESRHSEPRESPPSRRYSEISRTPIRSLRGRFRLQLAARWGRRRRGRRDAHLSWPAPVSCTPDSVIVKLSFRRLPPIPRLGRQLPRVLPRRARVAAGADDAEARTLGMLGHELAGGQAEGAGGEGELMAAGYPAAGARARSGWPRWTMTARKSEVPRIAESAAEWGACVSL